MDRKNPLVKLTVLCALLAAFAPFLYAQKSVEKPKEANFCSLLKLTGTPEGQTFRTRALMSYSTVSRVDGGDAFFYSTECNGGDYFAVADFSNKNRDKWDKFFAKLPREKNFIFEIILTGKLETSIIPAFGHLSWSRAYLQVLETVSIKDVTSTAARPDTDAETPLSDRGRGLMTVNNDILSYLLGSIIITTDIHPFIADEFVIKGLAGKSFDKNNYRELAGKGLFNNGEKPFGFSLKTSETKKLANGFRLSGVVVVEVKNIPKQTWNFENTYRSANDSWLLTEIKFSKP